MIEESSLDRAFRSLNHDDDYSQYHINKHMVSFHTSYDVIPSSQEVTVAVKSNMGLKFLFNLIF